MWIIRGVVKGWWGRGSDCLDIDVEDVDVVLRCVVH